MLRYIDTLLWDEDWFCDLGAEYQLLWNYITCNCNNAGIWKPNKVDFEIKSRTKINMVAFLEKINERGCKERVLTTETGRWFITGFIMFQWFNKKNSFDLILTNKLHLHIYDLLIKEKIPLPKVRGLKEVLKTPKDILIVNKEVFNTKNTIGVLGEVSQEVLNSSTEQEKYICPALFKVWQENFPSYPPDKKKDFTAIREIAEFIAETERKLFDIPTMQPEFKKLAEFVSSDKFYKDFSLRSISNNMQTIWLKIKNVGKSEGVKHLSFTEMQKEARKKEEALNGNH